MKKIAVIALIAFVVVGCVFLAGCTTQNTTTPKNATLTGSWIGDDGTTLTINKDGTISGKGPVNNYSGDYALTEKTISFYNLGSTKMAGSPEEMDKETEFFQKLENVYSFTLDDTLTLKDRNGNILLVFHKSS